MAKVIRESLGTDGIAKIQAELNAYKASLQVKNETFVRMLANEGLTVARLVKSVSNDHFTKQIAFGMVPRNSSALGVTYMVYATSPEEFVSWFTVDGSQHHDLISPVLMAEYGSGKHAIQGTSKGGQVLGGQGTKNTFGHAFESSGWWFATTIDDNGNPSGWVHSSGSKPSRPMKQAMDSMLSTVISMAISVFGS